MALLNVNIGCTSQLMEESSVKFSFWLGSSGLHARRVWLCSHGLESRFGLRSKTWLGKGFELRAFTCIVNAFKSQSRSGSAHCEWYFAPGQSARADLPMGLCMASGRIFLNAHVRITFRKSFAFTCPRIGLSRRITIQNAFQEPDLKQLCVHMGLKSCF